MANELDEPFILLGVALAIIALRLYARIKLSGLRGVANDDLLMIIAAIFFIVETILAYLVGARWKGLANNGMTPESRAALSPDSEEYSFRVSGSKTQVAGWCCYTTILWALKLSCCAYYLRLTDGLPSYRLRIKIGFGIVCATWVVVILAILLGCQPFSHNWQINPDPGNLCQPATSYINIFLVMATNILTDLYLMSIPLPMLWSVQIKTWKKLGLIGLFSGGIFIAVAGILRGALLVADPIRGAKRAAQWAVRETFVAVVCTNAPVISPLLRQWLTPLLGTMSSSKGQSNLRSGMQSGAIRLDDETKDWRSNRNQSQQESIAPSNHGSEDFIYPSRGITKGVAVSVQHESADAAGQEVVSDRTRSKALP